MDKQFFDNMKLEAMAGFWLDMADESSDSKEAALFYTIARIAMALDAVTEPPCT